MENDEKKNPALEEKEIPRFVEKETETVSKKVEETLEKKTKSFDVPEFLEILDLSEKNGFLKPEKKEKILQSLNDKQAEEIAKLWIKMFPIFTVFDIELISALSVALAASTGSPPLGVVFYIFLTSLQAGSAHQFVHWQGEKIDKKESLAKWSMIPHFGKYTPLVYLLRDHPDFLKFLVVYARTKKAHRKKSSFDKNSPEYKEQEAQEILKIQKALQNFEEIEKRLQRIKGWVKDTSLRVQNTLDKNFKNIRQKIPRWQTAH